jgi:PBSX family phage terminase large subunit
VVEVRLDYVSLPVHRPFHASTAKHRSMIGALGSGKSLALNMEVIRLCFAFPGLRAVIMRRFVPELRDSTEAAFFEALPAVFNDKKYITRLGGHVDHITFPNGSVVEFRGAEDPDKFKSIEYGLIVFDEVDQIPEADVRKILQRLRQTTPINGAVLPRGVKMPNLSINASNPAGKNWVWAAFVNRASAWPDSSIHLSSSLDNPFLPKDYLDLLMTYPLPMIRRIVYCSFDDAGGLVYPTWEWGKHVLPTKAPGHYGGMLYMATDPGIMAPTAGLWVEVDPAAKRMVAVAEYQEPDLAAPDHALNWRGIEKVRAPLRIARRIADPAISKRDAGTGTPLADIYAKLGFSFERGPVRQETRIPQLQQAIMTGRFFVTEATPRAYEQIAAARWEDQVPKLRDLGEYREKMRKHEDHIHDCAQYLAGMHIPSVSAGPLAPPPPTTADEIEEAWHRERRAAAAAQVRRNHASRQRGARRDGVVVC